MLKEATDFEGDSSVKEEHLLVRDTGLRESILRPSLPPALQEKNPFPSTRYYGSKKKQLQWLRDEFVLVKGQSVLDAFGGTGAVTHLWRSLGWEVTYNDVFTFNSVSARALFSDSTRLYSEKVVQEFLGDVAPVHGFISRTFEGLFYYREENEWLDGLLMNLRGQEEQFRCLLLHCLFQACLQKRPFNLFHRANLHLRDSKVPVKFGNRVTWAKPFRELMLTAYREVARMQTSAIYLPVNVLKPMSADSIPGKYDVVYIDPPYFHQSRTTEPYAQRYHFLEGLARYDEWPHLVDMESPIRQIRNGVVPEWSRKVDFQQNLVALISKYRKSKIILSYVSGEYPCEQDLIETFRGYFDDVRVSRRSFSRVLSKKKFIEILISGEP